MKGRSKYIERSETSDDFLFILQIIIEINFKQKYDCKMIFFLILRDLYFPATEVTYFSDYTLKHWTEEKLGSYKIFNKILLISKFL